MKLNVVLVQLDPIHRNPKASRAQAESVIEDAMNRIEDPMDDISFMILPEMAFTGYNFLSKRDIIEVAPEGERESKQFAKSMALKYNCGVIIGYTRVDEVSNKLYNSQYVVDPLGEVVATYDKSHLYENDETWAVEGSGFKSIDLHWIIKDNGSPLKACLGICMDINPKGFTAPYTDYELASFAKNEHTDILLFSSAWTTYEDLTDNDLSPINYWGSRLAPLRETDKFYFICANRIGQEPNKCWKQNMEGNTKFVGRSCVVDISNYSLVDYIPGSKVEARVVSFEF